MGHFCNVILPHRKKKEVQRNSNSVRGDKDDNIFSTAKYHGFSVEEEESR